MTYGGIPPLIVVSPTKGYYWLHVNFPEFPLVNHIFTRNTAENFSLKIPPTFLLITRKNQHYGPKLFNHIFVKSYMD